MITQPVSGANALVLLARDWWRRLLVVALLVVAHGVASAAEAVGGDLVSALDDGRLLVAGAITVDRTARVVCFPALVNQHHGQVEYLVVHSSGKRHEAVFVTPVRPQHVHFACLLVGAPEDGSTASAVTPVTAMAVSWQGHGPLVRRSANALVVPATEDGEGLVAVAQAGAGDTTATTPTIVWQYVGSQVTERGFAAELSGSLFALQADPSSLLIGTTASTHLFIPAADRLPAIGTPVTIELTFPKPVPTVVEPANHAGPRNP